MDSFVCKIVVLRTDERKILRPKNLGNNILRPPKATEIKKCLFGVPSVEDTERMLQEQYEIDRKRFIERFGIDLEKIGETEREENSENLVRNGSLKRRTPVISGRVAKRSRDVFKPRNSQTILTDFYQARKPVQSMEKSSKDEKEN